MAAAILITVVILSLSSPYFLTVPNLVNLVEAYSVTAILAAGVFVVLVCGGIDISFTATAAAAQYFAATLATKYGMPLVPTLLLSACLGIGLGALNALLIHYLQGRLDHRHHRDVEHLLRAADLFHRRARDLRPAGLVGRAGCAVPRR